MPDDGWWVHIKYYLLAGVLVCSLFGVLVSGYRRGDSGRSRAACCFCSIRCRAAYARGWHKVPPLNAGHFALDRDCSSRVLGLGFFKPRFWCKYVCPSGAVFSLGNLFRVTRAQGRRHAASTATSASRSARSTPSSPTSPRAPPIARCARRAAASARRRPSSLSSAGTASSSRSRTIRRRTRRRSAAAAFLSLAAGSAAAVVGAAGATPATKLFGAELDDPNAVAARAAAGQRCRSKSFLQMCIRCGECFKACPNNVLQPLGFQQGLEGLWTPHVVADWAGCESSCNACGQVCPTGAIRGLPLEEKKVARMGLAIVNPQTCLPFAGREACQLCVDECAGAGYHAIEFTRVGTEVDADGNPIEGTGFLAPVVLADKCVGCGLCQTRCYGINVAAKHLLPQSAIIIEAGEGKEDRLMSGSYIALREQEPASGNKPHASRGRRLPAGLSQIVQAPPVQKIRKNPARIWLPIAIYYGEQTHAPTAQSPCKSTP